MHVTKYKKQLRSYVTIVHVLGNMRVAHFEGFCYKIATTEVENFSCI